MAKSSRSAISGRFVKGSYARANKSTTVTETRGAKSSNGTYRSAKTGRYVTDAYGKSHPNTTIKDA